MKCSLTGLQLARAAIGKGRSRALARGCFVYHRMVLSSDCVTVERLVRILVVWMDGSIGTHGMLNLFSVSNDRGRQDGETCRLSLTAGGALLQWIGSVFLMAGGFWSGLVRRKPGSSRPKAGSSTRDSTGRSLVWGGDEVMKGIW